MAIDASPPKVSCYVTISTFSLKFLISCFDNRVQKFLVQLGKFKYLSKIIYTYKIIYI